MSTLLILTWLVPLAASALAPFARCWWLPAIAALPALATAALVPAGSKVEIPWLLLGSVLGLDGPGRIFLAFTSILWLVAGIYGARAMRDGPLAGRFYRFFLLAMAGNLLLIVALDLASFYIGFSLMGLASYGLVVHEGDRFALNAGKVYLVMALLGEMALFVALVSIAGHAGGLVPEPADLVGLGDPIIGLLILGLGIKAGLVPVHVWLPLAHPAAPVPASAVLSGAMIKVALLGWLRFLPIGEVPLTEWGQLLVVVGVATLFYAVPIGLVQSNPKVILAYSSVSKMGLMVLTLGLILIEPSLANAGVLAICLYAAHHALVKSGLFLGVGLRHHAATQWLVLAGIGLLAISLAGAPLSSGAVAKYGLKPTWGAAEWSWIATAVTLSTVGTALLMARFLWVIWRTEPHPSPGYGLAGTGWAGLALLSLLFSLLLGNPAAWSTNALPIAISLALALPIFLIAWRKPLLLRATIDRIPAGDLLSLVRPLVAALGVAGRHLDRAWSRLLRGASLRLANALAARKPVATDPDRLRDWPTARAASVVVFACLLVFALWPLPGLKWWAQPRVAAEESAEEPEPITPAESVAIDARPAGPQERPEREPTAQPLTPAKPPQTAKPAREAPRIGPPQIPDSGAPASPAVAPAVPATPTPPAPMEPEADPGAGRDEIAAPGPTPQVEPAPAASAATGTSASQDAAASPPGEAICDPGEVFVFAHPKVSRPLELSVCVSTPDGPRRLAAPPLTNLLVELIQRHLNDLGYDAGPVDGLIGPRTRGAISRFQRDHGEDPTGVISFSLLEQLRSAAASVTATDSADAVPE